MAQKVLYLLSHLYPHSRIYCREKLESPKWQQIPTHQVPYHHQLCSQRTLHNAGEGSLCPNETRFLRSPSIYSEDCQSGPVLKGASRKGLQKSPVLIEEGWGRLCG